MCRYVAVQSLWRCGKEIFAIKLWHKFIPALHIGWMCTYADLLVVVDLDSSEMVVVLGIYVHISSHTTTCNIILDGWLELEHNSIVNNRTPLGRTGGRVDWTSRRLKIRLVLIRAEVKQRNTSRSICPLSGYHLD